MTVGGIISKYCTPTYVAAAQPYEAQLQRSRITGQPIPLLHGPIKVTVTVTVTGTDTHKAKKHSACFLFPTGERLTGGCSIRCNKLKLSDLYYIAT